MPERRAGGSGQFHLNLSLWTPGQRRYVVPILQRRGLFHDDYPGPTLRENYGLPWPEQAARPAVTNGARHA
jgi:hypothetical protein